MPRKKKFTLKDIENHLARQDREKKRERLVSFSIAMVASALPVFSIGVASTTYALLSVKSYDFLAFLHSQEFYMFVMGLFIVGAGFWVLVKGRKYGEKGSKHA